MDIAAWLRVLSLERYAEAFRDNAIELEVLPELTEADLEKIGVLLDHRKIMLKAIAALGQKAPQSLPEPTPAAPADSAERRQLTVMFCDLVGSTPLSARLAKTAAPTGRSSGSVCPSPKSAGKGLTLRRLTATIHRILWLN